MSCAACESDQEIAEQNGDGIIRGAFYYRWKSANIAVLGCRTHVREVFDALNAAQKNKP